MTKFSYMVRDSSGKSLTGVMEAGDRNELMAKLRSSGYLITKITEVTGAAAGTSTDFIERLTARVSMKEVSVFSKQFAAMIDAGLTMIKCLRILETQSENKLLKRTVAQIRDDVASGSSISLALGAHPKIFSRLYVAMIKSGEESGTLDVTLRRLAEHMEKDVALRDQISAAMKYPQAIGFVMVGVVTFIMINVIPTFASMFEGLGEALPLPTQILINISNNMKSYWYIYLAIVLALPWIRKSIEATPQGRLMFDKIRLRLPVFGLLTKKIAVARFTRTLGTLLSSGVPIISALVIVEEVAGNVVIEEAISSVRVSIREGETIAEPLEQSGVFPPMVTSMIAVGEESGSLDEMLNKIADFYDTEVESMVKGLTALLEPVMITIMGVVVGGIVVALLLPLFKMIEIMRDMT